MNATINYVLIKLLPCFTVLFGLSIFLISFVSAEPGIKQISQWWILWI